MLLAEHLETSLGAQSKQSGKPVGKGSQQEAPWAGLPSHHQQGRGPQAQVLCVRAYMYVYMHLFLR